MPLDLHKLKQTRSIDELLRFGIVNLDKPSGPTSFDAADAVRRLLGAQKTGHFGTLDPLATGVLPVALNRATRLAPWFMKKDKTYLATMRLHRDVAPEVLRERMSEFVGEIKQLPPVRSRVKRQERRRRVNRFEAISRQRGGNLCAQACPRPRRTHRRRPHGRFEEDARGRLC
jgi:H/ACA ribonucleoprotein complex subunit 4